MLLGKAILWYGLQCISLYTKKCLWMCSLNGKKQKCIQMTTLQQSELSEYIYLYFFCVSQWQSFWLHLNKSFCLLQENPFVRLQLFPLQLYLVSSSHCQIETSLKINYFHWDVFCLDECTQRKKKCSFHQFINTNSSLSIFPLVWRLFCTENGTQSLFLGPLLLFCVFLKEIMISTYPSQNYAKKTSFSVIIPVFVKQKTQHTNFPFETFLKLYLLHSHSVAGCRPRPIYQSKIQYLRQLFWV